MSNDEQLAQHVSEWLADIRPAVERWLREVLARVPDGTDLLDCQYFGGEHGRGPLPLVIYPMTHSAQQVGGKHFKSDSIPSLPVSIVGDSRWEGKVWDAAGETTLFPWMVERWRAVNGPAIGYNAYICEHDDDRSLDLNSGSWIRDSQKWT